MANPRNLNDVLGAIARTLRLLQDSMGVIPPIQFLAVQKKSGVPGAGISAYVSDIPDFKDLSLPQKKRLVEREHTKIWSYPHWREVLAAAGGLEPLLPTFNRESLESAVSYGFGGPESAAHKDLKDLIASSPGLLGFDTKILATVVEYELPSGDCVDVFLETANSWIAVEVKAENAPKQEILRGLFQCVKYRALLQAMAGVCGLEIEAESVLALGGTLPADMLGLQNSLGIMVVQEVGGSTGKGSM